MSGVANGELKSGLCLLDQHLEGFGLMHREIGQHLAVDLNTGLAEPVDKSAVGQPVLAAGGVDALDPERTEVSLQFSEYGAYPFR